jgi:TetR/AcrR family transcriptional regulator, regulator of mycofactocin system
MNAESLRKKHGDRTRQAIAEAALALFRERGFHATTIDDIAQRADVAPRTFFRYYPTKESVLFSGGEDKLSAMRDLASSRPAGESPYATVVAVLRGLANEMAADSEWTSLVCHIAREDPALLDAQRRGMADRINAVLVEGIAEREGISPPDLSLRSITAAVTATIATAIQRWLDDGASTDVNPYIDSALEATRAAFT